MTDAYLLFDSTGNFAQSERNTNIPLNRIIPCETKFLRNHRANGCNIRVSLTGQEVLEVEGFADFSIKYF